MTGLCIEAIRAELEASDLWVDMDSRTDRPKTYANTFRIQLRTNLRIAGKSYHDIHETRDLPAWKVLTETRRFVLGFLSEIGGELGHVRVTNLAGNAEITPHVDIGEYCAIRDRYHLVINSENGTLFTSGDETVTMRENELWWFDNKQMHSVRNLSESPRTHLVFDVLPPDRRFL
jgi:phosphoenolpyruvate-protein kinase (PTS system EI component)